MDLDEAADRLYAVLPERFVAERTALAKQARSDGGRGLATSVTALRRPTTAAWAVNHLARSEPELLAQVLALGEQLRQAQSTLAGEELKSLTRQRGQLVQAVARRARALASDAGHPVSEAVEEEVEQTLRAALADPAAAEAVRSGRLTAALEYAGLGEVDLSSVAVAPSAARGPATRAAAPAGPSKIEVTRARRAVAEAEGEEQRAAGALAEAQDAHREAEEHQQELAAEIAELEQQLEAARNDTSAALAAVRSARRAHDVAARSAERARTTLARLQPPG